MGGSGDGGLLLPQDGSSSTGDALPEASVSFSRDVFPIVEQAGCASAAPCHFDTRSPTAHFSDYRTIEATHQQWTTGAGFDHCSPDGGPSIPAPPPESRLIPGRPQESLLIRKLTETRDACPPFYGRMPPPPRPPLSADQIETIRTWIREGARNN
jgi:hypothetical protein